MKSIGIVAPFFGNLPKLYEFWAKSVAANPTVDFHLVGDCFEGVEHSPNITVHHMSFGELQQLLADRLCIRPIDKAYKLCDFKPAYRNLFPEILGSYDVWGFCDFDLIFGDIRSVVDLDVLPDDWGRIFDFGHFSLFPNRDEANTAFLKPTRGFDSWSFVKNSRLIWMYDERYSRGLGGVNGLIEQSGLQVIPSRSAFGDPHPKFQGFIEGKIGNQPSLFFHWKNGRLLKISSDGGEAVSQEICYAHFQKRAPQIVWLEPDEALIAPETWPTLSSIEDVLQAAEKMRNADRNHRPSALEKSHWRRAKDWSRFLLECAKYPNGIVAMRTFLDGLKFER